MPPRFSMSATANWATLSRVFFFLGGGRGGGITWFFKGSGRWWTSRRQQSITGGMKKIGCPLTANEGNHATNKETYVRTKLKTTFQFCARLVFLFFFGYDVVSRTHGIRSYFFSLLLLLLLLLLSLIFYHHCIQYITCSIVIILV